VQREKVRAAKRKKGGPGLAPKILKTICDEKKQREKGGGGYIESLGHLAQGLRARNVREHIKG